jgi:hypothetical protein
MFSLVGKARLPVLAFGALLTLLPLAAQTGSPCEIASNFNRTSMIDGSTIWFTATGSRQPRHRGTC